MGTIFDYKYDIGDVIGNLEILEYRKCIKTNNKLKKGYNYVKGYLVKCLKCGVSYEKHESDIIRGRGCGVCSNQICFKGINDIATTHPHLVKYFVNTEDSYTHTYRSGIKVKTKCPDCGYEKEMLISNLTKRGYSCVCMGGASFPNKVITSILMQLNIKYECEKTFDWAVVKHNKYESVNGTKFYDHYIPSLKCIIENHGIQHYENRWSDKPLQEEQENDKIKRKLALANGIKYYIELDCRESTVEYIVNSVMNSELKNILNFSDEDIDLDTCYRFAKKNTVKEVCELWNSGVKNTSDIGSIVNLHQSTVSRYLKIGNELGICEYDAKKSLVISVSNNGSKNAKKVCMYNGSKKIGEFKSSKEIEKISIDKFGIKLNSEGIKRNCRGECDAYKGYIFKYV